MQASNSLYARYFKRIFDFLIALVGCIVLLPVFVITTLCLALANKGKPFFFQLRPGKDAKVFKIFKFKTMNDAKNPDGSLKPDAERLTRIGAFVRKTSLDEIPQLFNVLRGDMSLIGPRPLLVSYLEDYNEAEMSRLSVRPGITGLTGVSGRNNISWYDKMYYDIQYVRTISLALDIQIFFKTIAKVVIREGIAKEGHVTTDTFTEFCAKNPVREYPIQVQKSHSA